jgi:hypothetical protein
MHQQFVMKIPSLLLLIRHMVLTWHHPTSVFSDISRHLLQIVDEPLEAVIESLNEIQSSELHFVFTTGSNE